MYGEGVVAGTDDALDAGNVVAGSNELIVICKVIHEVPDGGAGALGLSSLDNVVEVCLDCSPEVSSGCAFSPSVAVAPHVHTELDLQSRISGYLIGSCFDGGCVLVGVVVADDGVNDFLCQLCACGVNACPECGLSGFVPEGEVSVVTACLGKELVEVLLRIVVVSHALDRQCVNSGAAVVGRVSHNVDTEDNVINGGGGAVGEDDIVTHGEVVVNGTVIVLNDVNIAHAIVGVIGAVVLNGLALYAVVNDRAAAVSSKQTAGEAGDDFFVIRGGIEEGAELLAEGGGCIDQGAGVFLYRSLGLFNRSLGLFGCGSVAFAASAESKDHNKSQNQSEDLLDVAHFHFSSLIGCLFIKRGPLY